MKVSHNKMEEQRWLEDAMKKERKEDQEQVSNPLLPLLPFSLNISPNFRFSASEKKILSNRNEELTPQS
jgi:hypothetical protein